ncbi:MAG TPA: hypothetical protein PKL97_04480 [Candidatus Omnitrophota bacterium]|nr:hypothetical protein [Candidatus Omnitrophota bacterium]
MSLYERRLLYIILLVLSISLAARFLLTVEFSPVWKALLPGGLS